MKKVNEGSVEKIKFFLCEHSGIATEEISESSSLEKDLGIYGDDAIELIIAYGKTFNVDVSKFMAAEYFSPEGDSILPALIRLITGKTKSKKKELTVGHLEKGIIAGRLDEDVINS